MIPTLSIILAALCLIFGVLLLFFPQQFLKISKVVDKHYSIDKIRKTLDKEISTEKLSEALEKYIDINEKLFKFMRLIGLCSLNVGIFLALFLLLII